MNISKRNDKKCAYPLCAWREHGKAKSIFRFPKEGKLLESWLEKIPFVNLKKINLDSAVLCADHFEDSLIEQGKGNSRKLKKGAIPTFFQKPDLNEFDQTCRLCLRPFKDPKDKLKLNDEIRICYKKLTHEELSDSSVYSEVICATCHSDLKKSCNFKYFITKNQQTLFETFRGLEDQKDSNFDDDAECPEVKMEVDHKEEIFTVKTELEDPILDDPENFDNYCDDFDRYSDYFNENLPENDVDNEKEKKTRKKKTPAKTKSKKIKKTKKKKKVIAKVKVESNLYRRKKWERSNTTKICDLCGQEFTKLGGMTVHMREKHIKKGEPIRCTYKGCTETKKFKYRGGLMMHINRVHLGKYDLFCDLCGERFTIKHIFEAHIRRHLGEKPFQCEHDECGKSFYSEQVLKIHKKIVHLDGPQACHICGKVYSCTVSLHRHMKHHTSDDKRFYCQLEGCGRSFVERHRLTAHMKMHSGQKDFVCRYAGCTKSFFQRRSLAKHVLSVHMQTKIACEVPGCTSKLNSKCTYRQHLNGNHSHLPNLNQILDNIRKIKLPTPDLLDGRDQVRGLQKMVK